jgi:hypothetical protein
VVFEREVLNELPFSDAIPWSDLALLPGPITRSCRMLTSFVAKHSADIQGLQQRQDALLRIRHLVTFGVGDPFSDDARLFSASDMTIRTVLRAVPD